MLNHQISAHPISAPAFSPFGDLLDIGGAPDMIINAGLCERYHDRARLEFGKGQAGVSLFNAQVRSLPYQFDLMERHPLGSQCFIPMSQTGFLVIVAPDDGGQPGQPVAFLTAPGQAINFCKDTWHGVLTPIHAPGLFAVVDRIGPGHNLEEFTFDTPFLVSGA